MGMILEVRAWFAEYLADSGGLGLRLDAAETLALRLREAGGLASLQPRPRAAYDRLLDGLNRLPRPIMVLGSLALVATGLIAPDWFAARMDTLSRMPEGLWWLIGGVVSLHFGARYQHHAQAYGREIVEVAAAAAPRPVPATNAGTPAAAMTEPDAALTLDTLSTGPNAAIDDWRAGRAA